MERGQFTFYRSYYEALKTLPKKEQGPVLMAIIAYALDGDIPELTGPGAGYFLLIKPTLDTGRRRAESGQRGGDKPKANGKQNESKPQAKRKQNVREKEKEREGEKEKEKEIEIENDSSISPLTPLSGVEAAMKDFAEMRKKIRKPLTEAAKALTLKELEKLAPGDEAKQIAILNQSIQRGWQGVFPLKEEERKPEKGLPKVIKPLAGGDDVDRLERMLGIKNEEPVL